MPAENRRVCTYFPEEHILAGFDDDLDRISMLAVLGDVADVLDAAESDSSVFFMNEERGTAYEVVVVRDATYEESVAALGAEQAMLASIRR